MENLIFNNIATFNFNENGIEEMDFETLKRTFRENDIYGNPIRGIYHYILIQRVVEICQKYNLNYEVENIFAAQNKNKNQPGVAILPKIEEEHGKNAVEAHILRRVFTTIQIKNWETEELTTTIAIGYHQDGIQLAIGPCVKICHNQCILYAERSASNYGKNKLTIEQLFEKVDEWLSNFEQIMNEDRERIQRLKSTKMTTKDLYAIIGMLTVARVKHDSKEKDLSSQVDNYPLNQGQISVFTEELLKLASRKETLTAWDVYNSATELYKPTKTDFPAIINQNHAMVEILHEYGVEFG